MAGIRLPTAVEDGDQGRVRRVDIAGVDLTAFNAEIFAARCPTTACKLRCLDSPIAVDSIHTHSVAAFNAFIIERLSLKQCVWFKRLNFDGMQNCSTGI